MRLSQNQIFNSNLNSILRNQQDVNKATQQLNTQKRVLSASDDASATARAMLFDDRIQANDQFTKNLTMLSSRLDTQESVLENIKTAIDSAYAKSIQAGNGGLSDVDRETIADELESIQDTILDLMNSKSEDGKFIFSGYQDNTQTYSFDSATGKYVYNGDQGQHKIKVSEGVEIRSSDNGFDVFESAEKRLNITSNTAVVSGGITSASVYVDEQGTFDKFHKANYNADPSAPAGANTFDLVVTAGTPNTYQLEQGGTVISTGSFEGNSVKVAGMEFKYEGAGSGQISFDLEKPQKENILNTLESMITSLRDTSITGDDYKQVLADGITGLDNAKIKISQGQAGLGGRLNAAKLVSDANSDLDVDNKANKAALIEVDFYSAISELTKHETALQASQATFGRLTNLSLLDYIR
ncbi:flagellar hook-associated protein FlgL [Pseudoalteromonas piscicida]|uniref:Flagellar hook-associated protein 3 FlgL n=1 Tax=Pseudoalteromonas piscicida TaxID=43662 RepID=A0ABN5C839_PSEO7|nr:flagellar hook-associated protein FlgL [Pseudoalteromonas piscicida]ATD05792.1 flagellar hook-associated protein 3 FlgL [Pseudoalteromonas piscicida]WPU32577.1 flagellar hook-associated protein FlgL [Pseudoalteromonas piscicida]